MGGLLHARLPAGVQNCGGIPSQGHCIIFDRALLGGPGSRHHCRQLPQRDPSGRRSGRQRSGHPRAPEPAPPAGRGAPGSGHLGGDEQTSSGTETYTERCCRKRPYSSVPLRRGWARAVTLTALDRRLSCGLLEGRHAGYRNSSSYPVRSCTASCQAARSSPAGSAPGASRTLTRCRSA